MTAEAGISVSQLNQWISDTLHRDWRLRDVTVTAEISGFKHHQPSGHWYFVLKDEAAAIPCVMFRQKNMQVRTLPKDGDRVTVQGYVEMFARDGRVQFYAMALRPAGLGNLYEQFETLKKKLDAEGLFDPRRKRLHPLSPRRVAVVTSPSGAALQDILNVSRQRSPDTSIVVVPSAVQGPEAGRELAQALRKAARLPQVDVIIIGRGGGSQEDLWCFNDEGLARAIAECPVPVVSGVGHEIDFTICDFVADERASTPSNAAEIVFPDQAERRQRIHRQRAELTRAMDLRLNDAFLRVHTHRESLQRLSPDRRLHTLLEETHRAGHRLQQGMTLCLRTHAEELRQLRPRLGYSMERTLRTREEALRQLPPRLEYGMTRVLQTRQEELRHLRPRMTYDMEQLLREREHALGQARTRLQAISPLKVLDRGYALVLDRENRVLPDAESAQKAGRMRIRFRDGLVDVEMDKS